MTNEAHVEEHEGKLVEAELLPQQINVLNSTAKNVLVTGGLGSGKTATGVHFVLKMITQYPESRGLICANSFKQLNEATLDALELEIEKLGFVKGLNYSRKEGKFTINGVDIVTHSLEAYEKLEGMEFSWALIDEAAKAKYEAYRTVKERVRKGSPCQVMLTTTTNGFNWLYDRFVTNADENHVTFKLKTRDNYFLPEDYYHDLVEQYGGEDTPIARQQLFGEFVNLSAGQVYNYFDEDLHLIATKRLGSKLYVGIDFNIGNMNAVVCEAHSQGITVLDEIVLNKGYEGTHEMAQELKSRYGVHNLEIIPDATGKARKSSSDTTDHNILKTEGFKLNTARKNPFIKDRQQELNHCFLKKKIEINPKCRYLRAELNKLNHEDDEGKVAHISVALGYVVHRLNIAGLRRKRKPNRTIYL